MQVSVLISMAVRVVLRWEMYNKSIIWVRLRTFWTILVATFDALIRFGSFMLTIISISYGSFSFGF